MKENSLPQFPKGLRSEFKVMSQNEGKGYKIWVLRDVKTDIEYELSPATIEGWEIPVAPSKGPSIIVSLGSSMVAMHLLTGEFYRTAPPPTSFRRKK